MQQRAAIRAASRSSRCWPRGVRVNSKAPAADGGHRAGGRRRVPAPARAAGRPRLPQQAARIGPRARLDAEQVAVASPIVTRSNRRSSSSGGPVASAAAGGWGCAGCRPRRLGLAGRAEHRPQVEQRAAQPGRPGAAVRSGRRTSPLKRETPKLPSAISTRSSRASRPKPARPFSASSSASSRMPPCCRGVALQPQRALDIPGVPGRLGPVQRLHPQPGLAQVAAQHDAALAVAAALVSRRRAPPWPASTWPRLDAQRIDLRRVEPAGQRAALGHLGRPAVAEIHLQASRTGAPTRAPGRSASAHRYPPRSRNWPRSSRGRPARRAAAPR